MDSLFNFLLPCRLTSVSETKAPSCVPCFLPFVITNLSNIKSWFRQLTLIFDENIYNIRHSFCHELIGKKFMNFFVHFRKKV